MTTVSLVLGSGGARGYAHIGVIEELNRRGYKIVSIAGSSMGALIGGVYAAGALDDYKDWVYGLRWMNVLRLLDVTLAKGAIRGDRIFNRLHELMGDPDIESLPLAYTAVAADITYQKEVWFQKGPLLEAMRASSAVPGMFLPVTIEEHLLVDGGVLNPLPIIPTVAAQADLIIAVDLTATEHSVANSVQLPHNHYLDDSGLSDDWSDAGQVAQSGRRAFSPPELTGRFDVLLNAVEVMQTSLTQYKIAGYPPDVIISIDKDICSFFDFHRAEEIVEAGRKTARDVLVRLEHGLTSS